MDTRGTESLRRLRSDYEREYGFRVAEDCVFKSESGISHELIDLISDAKDEPAWMQRF